MKTLGLVILFFGLLCVSVSHADLLKPQPFVTEQKVPPMSARAYAHSFKPNEAAFAQVYGNGGSSLSLYVFDTKGNCVAWDDNITQPQFCDENAVEWIADGHGRYSIEVRNLGVAPHLITMAIR
jgi:hypothetical protein